jgi:hypothetical protein
MEGKAMAWLKKVPLCVMLFILGGCASEVYRYPVQLTLSAEEPAVFTTAKTVSFTLDSGYKRTIQAGATFKKIGTTLKQEMILKPLNTLLTVEGAHMHEAYLVLKADQIVGFYLPVEKAFSPLSKTVSLIFQEERKP